MAAAAALQMAMDELSDRPKIPVLEFAGPASPTEPKSEQAKRRSKLIGNVQSYVDTVPPSIGRRASVRESMAKEYEALSGGPAAALTVALEGLNKLIALIDDQVLQSKNVLKKNTAMIEASLKSIASSHPMEARFARVQMDKLLEAATRDHNDLVEHYYFMLSLRSDFDPDSRAGPVFDNAKELDAYLRAQRKR
jgi:hypothetical protein